MRTAIKYLVALGSCTALVIAFSFAADSPARGTQDKYAVKVPGGLAFAEFRGYEDWPVVAISENNGHIAAILGNSVTMAAFRAGIPENGKPFPDGAKMAKVHWIPKKNEAQPGQPIQPGVQHDVDFMLKDSKRFADSGGWGYAYFKYDAASDSFSAATTADVPPQSNDAKCGFACHTVVKNHDYVFTAYARR
jgi:hypothetical protein